MSAPTPTPWRYQVETTTEPGRTAVRRFEIYRVEGPFGHPATCDREEDAKFICRAANAHESMLEALEDLNRDHPVCAHEPCPSACRYCFADAAIAKARGGA